MGTPRRYLPNLSYGRAGSLDTAKHDITLAEAVQDVAAFVAEKIPDINAKVSLFFKQWNKPSKNTGVKVHGIDGESVLIKVTVSKGPVKTMYTVLLKVEGFEATELFKLLSRQGNPVMVHALEGALEGHAARNAGTTTSDEKQADQEKKEVAVSKSNSILANFMKDKDNVFILLHSLREYGMGIKGVHFKELSSMLERAFEGTVKIEDGLFIAHCVSALSRSGYIKRPGGVGKNDYWMFDARAYETLKLKVPKRLTERPKKTRKKVLGITSKPAVHKPHVNGSSMVPPVGAAVYPTPDAVVPTFSSGGSLAKLLGLKEALKVKQEELYGLQRKFELVDNEIQHLEHQVSELNVNTDELRKMRDMLDSLLPK